jgi:hypothetical protein
MQAVRIVPCPDWNNISTASFPSVLRTLLQLLRQLSVAVLSHLVGERGVDLVRVCLSCSIGTVEVRLVPKWVIETCWEMNCAIVTV